MAPPRMALKFLGTSSMPNAARNYSSLLLKVDNYTVMVDCGESTQRQFQARYIGGDEKLSNLKMIMVTHLHADHVLGIVPLLMSMMGPSGSWTPSEASNAPRVEIFGPRGLRALIRTILTLCFSQLSGKYVVHELVWPSSKAEASTTPPPVSMLDDPVRPIPNLPLHESELPGQDIAMQESSASWSRFTSFKAHGQAPRVHISAAPITHRCPTVGYVFDEEATSSSLDPSIPQLLTANGPALLSERGTCNPLSLIPTLVNRRESVHLPDGTILHPPPLDVPGRKVVVLGDTADATGGLDQTRGMVPLARDADVLVHESTNIALPGHLNRNGKPDSAQEIQAKTALRGHSTPQGAGAFAALVNARSLILNHFSVKYPSPPHYLQNRPAAEDEAAGSRQMGEPERRAAVMNEFESQARQSWMLTAADKAQEGHPVMASFDGFVYDVPARARIEVEPFTMGGDSARKGKTPVDTLESGSWAANSGKAVPSISTNGHASDEQEWDPSPYLLGEAAPARPHAVILLNSPMEAAQKGHLLRVWTTAKLRLCADGAANRLVETFGYDAFVMGSHNPLPLPHAIVGDLDSIRPEVKDFFAKQGVKIQVRPSQYATDLQKSVQAVEDFEASGQPEELVLVIFGGLAGRLDQSIHTLHVLWQLAPRVKDLGDVKDPGEEDAQDKRGGKLKKRKRTFVIGDDSVAWLLPKGKHQMRMSRKVMGKTCGILPLGTGTKGAKVHTRGLEWDLNGEPTTLGGFLSTSNHLSDDQGLVELETDEPIYWTVELQRSDLE